MKSYNWIYPWPNHPKMNRFFTFRKLTFTFLLITISNILWAQGVATVVKASHPLNPARYDEIKGSPYLYDTWYKAKIVGSDGKIYEDMAVNFNGLTHQLELKKDGRVSQLNNASYLKVIIHTDSGEEAFFRGIHPAFGANLVCILFDGEHIKLLKMFTVRKQATEVQTPMNPTVFEKFVPNAEYYLMIDGDLTQIKLKKKKIIEALGHKSAIEAYVKENKIDLSQEIGIKALLQQYESTMLQ